MSPAPLSPVLAILAAACWGTGDWCGGMASRRSSVLGVLATGHAVGIVLVVVAALVVGDPIPAAPALAWAAAAGVTFTLGLAALYRGLAVGRMALVAPVSAVLQAAIPAGWAALSGGPPPASRLAGFGLALVGIWLAARPSGRGGDGRGVLLALAAGVGIGASLVLVHAGAGASPLWPVAAARLASLLLVIGAGLARGGAWTPTRSTFPLAAASGLLDVVGTALFLVSSRRGSLDVAAVLAAMYPAFTLLLAAGVLRERVSRKQGAGIAAMLAAIVLIVR